MLYIYRSCSGYVFLGSQNQGAGFYAPPHTTWVKSTIFDWNNYCRVIFGEFFYK
jgi:hypothetical protein